MQLYEKYRPESLNDFIGQQKIKKQLSIILQRNGWDRDVFWIQGPSGTGKTSLAWIIARQLAHDFDIIEMDGDKCTAQAVRDIERHINLCSMFGKWKVWIVNEAHAMNKQAIQAWLTLLERLPANRLILFTTTETLQQDLFGSFSGPFARRCKVFNFTNQGLAQNMATHAREIALAEGLDGKPVQAYLRLIQDCKNNLGLAIQRIETGEMI